MELEIIEQKNNSLLNRREIKFKIRHDGATPSRTEVKKTIAAQLNMDPDLVIIDHMNSKFGKSETKAYVKIYESIDAVKAVERVHILKRNTSVIGGAESEQG